MINYAKKYITGRCIVSGFKVEFKEYSVPVLAEPRKHNVVKHWTEQSKKRNDNLYRARKTVRQRVWANIQPHSKFLTLTTANTVLDVTDFRRMLTTFFQSMKREGFDLKYLYVLERQLLRGSKEGNAGSIHAHIIIFNDEYIPFEVLNKCWKHGRTELKMIDGLRTENKERVRDVGAYVCKYITKEASLEWGSRCFNCSKGLNKPIEIPKFAYGFEDTIVEDIDNDYNRGFDMFNEIADITYENATVVQYGSSDGRINQIIDYKQGFVDVGEL